MNTLYLNHWFFCLKTNFEFFLHYQEFITFMMVNKISDDSIILMGCFILEINLSMWDISVHGIGRSYADNNNNKNNIKKKFLPNNNLLHNFSFEIKPSKLWDNLNSPFLCFNCAKRPLKMIFFSARKPSACFHSLQLHGAHV